MAPTEAELKAGVVVGVGALNNDEVRPRLDIDVMIAKQPDTFNLFLLALIELKADTSKLGFFALAGKSSMILTFLLLTRLIAQVFMDFPPLFGTMWGETFQTTLEATAPMADSSFPPGTDLTSRFSRQDMTFPS